MPLAGAFASTYSGPEHDSFPLTLMWCESCKVMQTGQSVNPDRMFLDYSYRSSAAPSLVSHFKGLAARIQFAGVSGLVVDVGCNDGVLLRPLKERGISVAGIDPSDVAKEAAAEGGWPLLNDYLTPETAKRFVEEHGLAEVVVATNVLAHTDSVHTLCEGISAILAPHGTFIGEVHYLRDLIEGCQFDTVYHEHTMYYSMQSLRMLFEMHGLYIVNVDRISTHAGSIRVWAEKALTRRTPRSVTEERIQGVEEFGDRARSARSLISEMMQSISRTKRVWAYGAAGRCTIMLNWCELGSDVISRVVDSSPRRIGRLIPGVRTPIVPPVELERGVCEFVLVTAWNYFDAIRGQHPNPHIRWIRPLPVFSVAIGKEGTVE